LYSGEQKHIKLNFVDFWSTFKSSNNYFYNLLKTKYTIETSNKPDFLIYSVLVRSMRIINAPRFFILVRILDQIFQNVIMLLVLII